MLNGRRGNHLLDGEKDAKLIFNYGSEFGRLGEPCVMHSRCQVSTNFREWRLRFRWTSASTRSRVDQCSLHFSPSENCVSLTIQHFQFVKRATYSSKQRHRANMFMRPTFGEDSRRFHLTCFSDRFACCRLSISSHTEFARIFSCCLSSKAITLDT